MKMLERIRSRPPRPNGDGVSAEAAAANGHSLPIPGYDRLDGKQVAGRLSQLSQLELATVETYERAHAGRPAVLHKLRYMRGSEPLPGYDALSPEAIATALSGADAETVKAVRDYERKFAHRRQVLQEAARVLPTAPASARQARAREEQDARVREGFAGRERAGRRQTDGRSARPQHD
jgi:predicted ArsR family transcriptional regulator